MAGFQMNSEAMARETRSERLEQRIKPSMKRAIEFAATLTGTDTSEFITSAAYREAMRRIEEASITRLSADETKKFFAALDRTSGPNEAMAALMADYDKNVENAIR